MIMNITDAIPIMLSACALTVSIWSYCKNVVHDRKQATLDAFNLLQEQVLDKMNAYTAKEISEISLSPRSAEYKEVTRLMARIEHFSVGVNSRIYDEETLQRLAGVYFLTLYNKLKPIIEKKRSINKTERHYDEFETLVSKMRDHYNNQ